MAANMNALYSTMSSGHSWTSKYLEKVLNKYLNIFEKLKPYQTNMQIYSKDWNHHKQIFEYIGGQSLNKYFNIIGPEQNYKYALIT